MKKIYSIMIYLGLSVTGMAQQNFELGKPNDDNYRYLDEYAALKEYVNRDKYPNSQYKENKGNYRKQK